MAASARFWDGEHDVIPKAQIELYEMTGFVGQKQ